MKYTLSFTIAALFAMAIFMACGDNSKEKAAALEKEKAIALEKEKVAALDKETMSIHDDAMKTLGEMNSVAMLLKAELKTAESTNLKKTRKEALVAAIADMQKAEDDMMSWMSQYKSPDNLPPAEAIKYLEDQKQKISQNQQDLKKALELGKSLQTVK